MTKTLARLNAFNRVAADPHARRALMAFGLFSVAEFGIWVTILVHAHSIGGAGWVSGAAVVQLVPAAVLAPILASRLARLGPARAIVVAYATQTVALAVTALSATVDAPAVTLGLATLTNIAITTGRPAHSSLLPALADGPVILTAANVATTSLENIGVFAGPALAGAVLAVTTPAAALAVFAGCLGMGTILASGIGCRPSIEVAFRRTEGTHTSLRSTPGAMAALTIGGAQQLAIGALDVLIVVFAIEVLQSGEAGAANLTAVMGVGGVVGGLVATSMVGRDRLLPSLTLGVLLRAGSLVAMGWLPFVGLLLATVGIGYAVVDVGTRTLLQRVTHGVALARAFGYLEGLTMAALAVGALVAPPLVGVLGVQRTFPVIGLALPLALVLAWRPLSRADRLGTVPHDRIDALEAIDMFGGLEPPAVEALARSASFVTFETDEAVVVEGEHGDRMWAILAGSARVSRSGVAVKDLSAGSVFGEIALVSARPRIATVRALEPIRALEITRAGFIEALSTSPAMRTAFEDMASRRSTETLGT